MFTLFLYENFKLGVIFMLMFKFPFILLLGLISLIIPILIQLISKMRRKKLNFPTIFLFEKELTKINKVSKFKDWLLLAIRVILFILIALILAQPSFKQNEDMHTNKNDGQSRVYLLIIDDSFSSMIFHKTSTLIDLWKEEASKFIMSSGTDATIGITHFNSVTEKPIYTKDKHKALNQITFITPQANNKVDVPDLLGRYAQSLNEREEEQKYLVLFSDFQKIDWESVSIDTKAQIIIRDIEDKSSLTNYSINEVYSPQILKFTSEPIELYLTIQAYSNKAVERMVSIFESDNRIYEEKISIEPHTMNDYRIAFSWFKPGKYHLKVQLDDDNYNYDNYAYQKIYPTDNLRIYIATTDNDLVIRKALSSAIGTEYQTETRLISIDTERNETKNYDIILSYGLTSLEQSEIDYIIGEAEKGKLVIIIYSNSDNPYLLGKILTNKSMFGQNLNFGDRHRAKEYMTYPKNSFDYDFNLEYLHLQDYKISFKNSIETKINPNNINTLLTDTAKNNLLISNKSKNNLYFLSSDVSLKDSNIIYSQAFPLLINSLIYKGIVWKFELKSHFDKNHSIHTNINTNVLNQGKAEFMEIESLKGTITGEDIQILTYNDINILNNGLFLKTKEKQEKNIYQKTEIEFILYLLFSFFLLLNMLEIIFSAIRRG